MAASGLFEIPFYNPAVHVKEISCPALVVSCEGDELCPWKGSPALQYLRAKGGELVQVRGGMLPAFCLQLVE
jgi:hypothetical protein